MGGNGGGMSCADQRGTGWGGGAGQAALGGWAGGVCLTSGRSWTTLITELERMGRGKATGAVG